MLTKLNHKLLRCIFSKLNNKCPDEYVGDVEITSYSVNLKKKYICSARNELDEEERRDLENFDDEKVLCIVLESPHNKEFEADGTPLGPARGITGTKLKIILIVIFIIVFPVLVIPLLFSVMNYLPDIFSFLSFNLEREFFAEIQLNSYLTLYLSIISIIVSAIIAISLFRFERQQKRREKEQQQKQNKEMVFFFFERAITQAFNSQQETFWDSFDFVDISDNIFSRINSIKSLMNNGQFMLLNKIIDKLKDINELEKNDNYPVVQPAVDELMELITIPVYSTFQYHLKQSKSVWDLSNKDTIELYNVLAPDDKAKIYSKDKILNKDGNVILETENELFRVFDSDGHKICEAEFDKQGIVEGEAKIFDFEGTLIYEGEFENHQRNGQGVEYLYNRIKTKEGTWQDGELVDGVIYNVLIWEDKSLFADQLFFLADEIYSFSSPESYDGLNVCSFSVNNGKRHVIDNSIKPAELAIENFKMEQGWFE